MQGKRGARQPDAACVHRRRGAPPNCAINTISCIAHPVNKLSANRQFHYYLPSACRVNGEYARAKSISVHRAPAVSEQANALGRKTAFKMETACKKRRTAVCRSALFHGAAAAPPLVQDRPARALTQRKMSSNTSERLISFNISCRPSSYRPSITSRIPASQSFS